MLSLILPNEPGLTDLCFLKNSLKSAAKSFIGSKLLSGSTVITSVPKSYGFVSQASLGTPFIIIPQEPHIPILQLYLKDNVASWYHLIFSNPSSTVS